MSERLYRVLLLEEVGAVAPKLCTVVGEMDLALNDLCSGHGAPLVIFKLIRMDEIDTTVVLCLLLRPFRRCRHGQDQA